MAELKVGMIGLDTSHVSAFVKLLNDPTNEFHVPGAGCNNPEPQPRARNNIILSIALHLLIPGNLFVQFQHIIQTGINSQCHSHVHHPQADINTA